MPTAFPHLHDRIGQDLLGSIGEDSTSTITTSRIEERPSFLEPHAAYLQENLAFSSPTYSQVRNASRPGITRIIGTEEEVTLQSTEHRGRGQPVMSNNLTNLNDIRHEEMVGRLSAVPHYPVYLEAPARHATRHRSRSPASIASSSTTTILISVGQLPGSEPFDPSPPPMNMYQPEPSSISSPTIQRQAYPANSVRTEATVSGPLVAQPAFVGHAGTVSQISWFWDDLSQEYWKPPDGGYYAPEARSNSRHTIHLSNRQDSRDLVPSCRSPNPGHPSPPRPKDQGYVAPTRNNGRSRCIDMLRQYRSSTHRRRKDK